MNKEETTNIELTDRDMEQVSGGDAGRTSCDGDCGDRRAACALRIRGICPQGYPNTTKL